MRLSVSAGGASGPARSCHHRVATNGAEVFWSRRTRTNAAASRFAVVPRTVLGLASCRLATKATEPVERSSVQPVSARAPSRTSCSVYPPARPRVNSSMNSRERFSLGALTVFCWPSSQNRRAGSTTIASARSVKVPRPLARRVAFCASSIGADLTLRRRRREVVVPAEGELLDDRVLHGDHPADPPRGEVGHLVGDLLAAQLLLLPSRRPGPPVAAPRRSGRGCRGRPGVGLRGGAQRRLQPRRRSRCRDRVDEVPRGPEARGPHEVGRGRPTG